MGNASAHILAAALLVCLVEIGTAQDVDFAADVAPIFQQHCVRCHSSQDGEGELSLTTAAGLATSGMVTRGDPDDSGLLDVLIAPSGGAPRMPKEGRPLSKEQVTVIRRWIEDGAEWPDAFVIREASRADASWWAWQPIDPSSKPLGHSGGPVSVDAFVRARLKAKGLNLGPRADRRTLIRRLSFDLHGMPPTPEAVRAFEEDEHPDAWARLVDEMLNAPEYGERYARHWLDIAHYADTHGFERDKRRDNAWRYRDYVIRALNEDRPYHRFLQEQIAGDVLWPDDDQAVIATGFLAAGPWDFVGQVETKSPMLRRSAVSLDLDDMATQVITATLGMTVNCARCHDHKLDPISQREYYELRAVFAGVRREDRAVSDAATARHQRATRELTERRNQVDAKIAELEGTGLDLADIVGGGDGHGTGRFRQGLDPRDASTQSENSGQLANVVTNRFVGSSENAVDGVFIPDGQDGRAKIQISSSGLTITGLPATSGRAWDFIRNGPVASQHSPVLGAIDFTKDGHTLIGLHANAGITFDLMPLRERLTKRPSSAALRFTTKVGYFGATGGFYADAWVFLDGRKVAEFRKLKRADGLQRLDIELPPDSRYLTLVATDGGNGFGHDQVGFGDPRVRPVSNTKLSKADKERLVRLRVERKRLRDELASLASAPRFYGVVAREKVPEVRVLTRGNPEMPAGDPLFPAGLSALRMLDRELGARDSEEATRRAALAKWITDRRNPLVRRVIVNRIWQWHFGRGIVDTPSDFGYGGGRPSHPALLDWLAEQLLTNEWSLKAMHRLILTSDTYQQSSLARVGGGSSVDADNRLLWRQNTRRIEAESIRDSVLFVSGKLNLQRGGPGFEDFTYKEAYAPIYTYITADAPELWRRSIYRYIVRTTPDRFLTTLDCPDPANLTPRRLTTTTPLQSLALYNNEFMLKQAAHFAERVRSEVGEGAAEQVERAFRLAFARPPTDRESRLAVNLVQAQGLFVVCRALLNSNEFVYVD